MNVDDPGRAEPVLGRERSGNELHGAHEMRVEFQPEAADPLGQEDVVDAVLEIPVLAADVEIAIGGRVLAHSRSLEDDLAERGVRPERLELDLGAADAEGGGAEAGDDRLAGRVKGRGYQDRAHLDRCLIGGAAVPGSRVGGADGKREEEHEEQETKGHETAELTCMPRERADGSTDRPAWIRTSASERPRDRTTNSAHGRRPAGQQPVMRWRRQQCLGQSVQARLMHKRRGGHGHGEGGRVEAMGEKRDRALMPRQARIGVHPMVHLRARGREPKRQHEARAACGQPASKTPGGHRAFHGIGVHWRSMAAAPVERCVDAGRFANCCQKLCIMFSKRQRTAAIWTAQRIPNAEKSKESAARPEQEHARAPAATDCRPPARRRHPWLLASNRRERVRRLHSRRSSAGRPFVFWSL